MEEGPDCQVYSLCALNVEHFPILRSDCIIIPERRVNGMPKYNMPTFIMYVNYTTTCTKSRGDLLIHNTGQCRGRGWTVD